jgi:hypothetical protein
MLDPLSASCRIAVSKPYSQGVRQWIETVLLSLFFCLVASNTVSSGSNVGCVAAGFEPALTDEKVITIEICGDYFKYEYDKDIFVYVHTHYLHFFQKLPDRSLFTRHTANLWQIKTAS